ncbi:hypothetical protein IC582_015997 [Cucumis melo]
MKIEDLGFILVDLKRIGHKSDSFIMETQARQVFYVEDPSDARWSIVLTPPQRDCEDQLNDDELGDIMLHCQGVPSDMPNIDRDDQDKEVGGAEIDGLVVGVVDEYVEKPKQQRKRGPTIMFDVTRVRSKGERKLVEYNEDGVPIGENGVKLNSFIGSCVHYHIPIIYATWIDVPVEFKEKIYTTVETAFIINSRSSKSILKTAETTFRQFKHWLTKKYILPFKNEPELLKRPPYMYSYIDQKQWEEFVRSRLCPHFEDEISKTCADKEPSPNDVLTQALGTRESSWRVRGVGGFVTPTTYFHTAKRSKKRNEKIDKLSEENEKLRLGVQELENIHISTQSTPTSAHGSCSRPRLEYDIQCKKNVEKEVVKEEVNEDVIILNDLQEDAIEVRNEKEVVCESNIKMPPPLKTILRFAEKVMDKDSGIRYQLPFSLFGIGRKMCVLQEDIIDFCNMREVKTLTLVAYMA